jgi:hypothetical protein
MASAGLVKKKGGSRSGSWPISRAVGGIVAADTEDAAHRKQIGGPMDRNADDGRRLDDITHHFLPLARAFMKAAGA